MCMNTTKRSGVIAAGLALFSMFFGAGDLIWPLILGGNVGDKTSIAMLGLLLTGVTLPLLGCIAMTLFEGNIDRFFGQIGKKPAFFLIFLVQAILGPIGSIPRLITLSHATLKPYMADWLTLAPFSLVACAVVFLFVIKKHRLIDILGYVLTPILLLSLVAIFVIGFYHHPQPQIMPYAKQEAFFNGLSVGYNTLDLIASFIFAPFVLSYFIKGEQTLATMADRKAVFKNMAKASLLAALILSGMYIGLTHISSYYTPLLSPNHLPEERLSEISHYLLGPYGGLVSCIAVVMACLTTAIAIAVIVGEYVQKTLLRREKGGYNLALVIVLGISAAIANLGFMGIANMLSPVLQILCPGLILLSVLNILYKLYEMPMRKTPVYMAFAISAGMHFIH